jgi:hypothetical protein
VPHLEPLAALTLDGLVERGRAAGVAVALAVEGERRPWPQGHRSRASPDPSRWYGGARVSTDTLSLVAEETCI